MNPSSFGKDRRGSGSFQNTLRISNENPNVDPIKTEPRATTRAVRACTIDAVTTVRPMVTPGVLPRGIYSLFSRSIWFFALIFRGSIVEIFISAILKFEGKWM